MTGCMHQLNFDLANTDNVTGIMGDQIRLRDPGRASDPRNLVTLYVYGA